MLTLLPMILITASLAGILILRAVKPRFAYFWLASAAGVLPAWGATVWLKGRIPEETSLVTWEPSSFFPHSPALLLDGISWPFALALTATAAAAVLSDVSRATSANWKAWASIQALTVLGLFAVLAANPLTLLLVWTAVDLVELVTLLGLVKENQRREQVIAGFAARAAGLLALLWASLVSLNTGESLTFATITPQISPYLLLAAGLRLGVLPLHQPFLERLPLQRSLGAVLRLVPAAASLVLLARTAFAGAAPELAGALYALSGLAALYAAISWASAEDEVAGRPFWILGSASFAVGAAVISQPAASLAWGLICLLSGGVLFLFSPRRRALLFLPAISLLFFTTLPYSPGWDGVGVYWSELPAAGSLFVIAQALLLAGYVRHALRPGPRQGGAERWVWAVYPLGLALLPLSHALLAYWGPASAGSFAAGERSLLASWPAGLVLLLAAAMGVLFQRGLQFPAGVLNAVKNVLSLSWVYRGLWGLYRSVGRMVGLLNQILEGEGGMLWTLLLLTLLLALVMQTGQGGQ